LRSGAVLQSQDVRHPLHQNGGAQDLDLVLKARRRDLRRDLDIVQIDDLEALKIEHDPGVGRILRFGVDGQEHAEGGRDQRAQDNRPLPPPK
jgi:hypothetical protein